MPNAAPQRLFIAQGTLEGVTDLDALESLEKYPDFATTRNGDPRKRNLMVVEYLS